MAGGSPAGKIAGGPGGWTFIIIDGINFPSLFIIHPPMLTLHIDIYIYMMMIYGYERKTC
jgi:hypothetical protein